MLVQFVLLPLGIILFCFSFVGILCISTLYILFPGKQTDFRKKKLLVIDSAYSYKAIRDKSKQEFILQRNLGNFFEKVFTLYPLLGANPFDKEEEFAGAVRVTNLAQDNIFIEAKFASVNILHRFPRTNYLITQYLCLLKMRQFILKENISVLRGCDPFLTGLYCLLLSKMTLRPFAIRIGANFDLLYKMNGEMILKKIFKWYSVEKTIARAILPRANLVLAATQNYLDYALENGAKKERSVVTRFGNIINPIHFKPPSERIINHEKYPFIGGRFGIYVGRLTNIKLPGDLLFVAHQTHQLSNFSEVQIIIVGDGDMRKHLEKSAKEMGLEKTVLFLGDCAQEEIAGILPYASAYLAPHSGLSLVEAALAEIPLIAYDYEWHPEIVKHGQTGELAPHKDWKKMGESFVRILTDPQYAKVLGKNARILALDMMNQEKIWALEAENYQKIISESHKAL